MCTHSPPMEAHQQLAIQFNEITWLVSSYVLYVWEMVYVKKLEVKLDKFFGYLTFKYKMYEATSPDHLINLHCF